MSFTSTLLQTSDWLAFLSQKLRGMTAKVSSEVALTQADCERQNWRNVRPCFVLSTGRSGTLMLTNLLLSSQNVQVVHQPRPELIRASRLAYEQIETAPEIFREVFKSAREEYLLESARRQQVFVETNNRITFFAPIIKDVFPNAVFIHIVRHPGDFVRSGVRRGWYSGQHDHDIGRITPKTQSLKSKWNDMGQIAKITWLWNETNQFVENFKTELPKDFLFIKAEDMFARPEVTRQIFDFLRLHGFDEGTIKALLKRPANVQRKGKFPPYSEWPEEDKAQLREQAPLAVKYGYQF